MELKKVISVDNMRKSDAHTIASHTPSKELMLRAARGIFEAVRFTGNIAIVCGKGNNGGDGYALACILLDNGFSPVIVRVSDGFSEDGLYYYKRAKMLGAQEISLEEAADFTGFDIVVDCILGTGFSGRVNGNVKNAIEQINSSSAYIISADINSGINGDNGIAEIAVNSDLTVSIGYFKTGLFLNDAPYYIDSLVNAEIGVHLLEDEYMLIDYSRLPLFEGEDSLILSCEEFYEKFGFEKESCSLVEAVKQMSAKQRKPVVVKTSHSAVIADIKYVYFCADYVK